MKFYKYQGTGNDFVMIDNREGSFPKEDRALVARMCDRRFGIGADGLILLEASEDYDFTMVYYNSDGGESTMCGNGGRCLVAFARDLGIVSKSCTFDAIDGLHHADINGDIVHLGMIDVTAVKEFEKHSFLDTGSPHHVEFVEDVAAIDLPKVGAAIRYGEPYGQEGTNVNFVENMGDNHLRMRTYERGVEDETLSCGTGATAVAISSYLKGWVNAPKVQLSVPGGELSVSFDVDGTTYNNVVLAGPAMKVFNGDYPA